MNPQEFQTAISPILLKWPRGYSGDQVQLIQEEVKTLSHPDFVRVARHLLGSMRVAPMVPDFRKAISDLGIVAQRRSFQPNESAGRAIQEDDFVYHIEGNVWANNKYIFLRGERPGFIVKASNPEHPYVIKDNEVRHSRIKEVKEHLKNGTYGEYSAGRGDRPGLKLVNISMEEMA